MKVIDVAKEMYPALSKQDILELTCPDNLLIVPKLLCDKTKEVVDDECIACWNVEISQARADWLIQSRKIMELMER